MTPVFLTAEWRHLVMLSYEAAPDVLRPRVPAGTELDSWRGKTFVSIVGFRFTRTKVRGIPVPFHRNFDEVNLRFYVRRDAPEGERRGVVFIKEIVPRVAIAWVANRVYNESYVALPMRHHVDLPEVAYEWRHGGQWSRLAAEIVGEPSVPMDGSEEAFITEHYWGYARQRDSSTVEYRVEHPRWNVWRTTTFTLEGSLESLYPVELANLLRGEPSSVLVAGGSKVLVREGTRLPR